MVIFFFLLTQILVSHKTCKIKPLTLNGDLLFFSFWLRFPGNGRISLHFPSSMCVFLAALFTEDGTIDGSASERSHFYLPIQICLKIPLFLSYLLSFKLKPLDGRAYFQTTTVSSNMRLLNFRSIFTSASGYISFFLLSEYFYFVSLFLKEYALFRLIIGDIVKCPNLIERSRRILECLHALSTGWTLFSKKMSGDNPKLFCLKEWECCVIVLLTEGRRRGQQRMRWLNDIPYSVHMSLHKLWEIVKDREARHAAVHGVTKSQTQLISSNNIKCS